MSTITYEDYVEAAKNGGFEIELSEEDFSALSEEQLDEISSTLARKVISKTRDEKETTGRNKKDRTKAVELAGKKVYGIGGKAKVSATEEVENMEDTLEEGSMALGTLKAGSKPDTSNTKSRAEVMASAVGILSQMPKRDLLKWFDQTMSQFGPNKTYGVGDNSESNKATIKIIGSAAGSVKEDVAVMFDGEELSEEFKEKASTLFEAALATRLTVETARLEEEYEERLNEEIETVTTDLTEKLDTYLDYVVENWMKENVVAIETTLRNELMDDFMESLKKTFTEHYIDVPQEKMDVLEALTEKVAELEEQLNETISENVELRKISQTVEMNSVFDDVAEGLALTQVERFRSLAEGIEFDGDLTAYERKLNIIKEAYFTEKPSTQKNSVITEEFIDEDGQVEEIATTPEMKRWAQAISRTVKK